MGLFSDKISTVVGSTTYNMAGDENLRPKVLPTIVINSVLSGSKNGTGKDIYNGLMSGTGMRQRQFFNWAKTNYGLGMPVVKVTDRSTVPTNAAQAALVSLVSPAPGEIIRARYAVIDSGNPVYWGEDWIRRNAPSTAAEDWEADFDPETSEFVVTILEAEHRFPASADFLWSLENPDNRLVYLGYERLPRSEEDYNLSPGTIEFLTYRLGSGNVYLDDLIGAETSLDPEFYPVLPVRLSNAPISDPAYDDMFPAVKKAYRKMTGGNLNKLLDSIEDNESIEDVDHAFLVPGVSLNAKDKTAKDYIFRLLKLLISYQSASQADIEAAIANYNAELVATTNQWTSWANDNYGVDPLDPEPPAQYGTAAPETPQTVITSLPVSTFDYVMPGVPNFKFAIGWVYIHETVEDGNAAHFDGNTSREPVAVGEYYFANAGELELGDESVSEAPWGGFFGMALLGWQKNYHKQVYCLQETETSYRKLEVLGLSHLNYVYKNKVVTVLGKDALNAEDESGFVLPLHYPTLTSMKLLDATQLTTSSLYIVFNSYERVRRKWYQSGLFKVVVIVASVALSIASAGGSLAAAGGILGNNLALGTALGVTSAAAAAVVGAIANAVAGIVVTAVIQRSAQALFGDELGAIIGAIASFVVGRLANSYYSTGELSMDWASMFQADNLLKLTDAVSGAYASWSAANVAAMREEMSDLQDNYEGKLKEVEKLSDEILGMTSGTIDPMIFTDATEQFGEELDSFLSRTLLTGSDIADLSHMMVENFVELSLEIPENSSY